MAGTSHVVLYPDMSAKDRPLARDVIESYWENRKLHEIVDDRKQKALKFVHSEQWDEDVEAERANQGLPSLVADKTSSVWRTLDGYARRNQTQIRYVQAGDDDFEGAELHDKIFTHISTQQNLNHVHSKAYGMAAITDESYVYISPRINAMGRISPGFQNLGSFECYPDANFKDPIKMSDAEFIDLPTFHTPQALSRKFDDDMTPAFRDKLDNYNPHNPYDEDRTRNQYKYREGETTAQTNGMLLTIVRFFKDYKRKTYIINPDDQSVEPAPEGLSKSELKKIAEPLGFELFSMMEETLMICIVVPDVSEDCFLMDPKPAQFQPINPDELGKVQWPIVRYVHNLLGDKAVGAIGNIIKLQEARNSILSALLHHLQTAANGGMMRERGAFNGDEVEENKFDTERNRGGYTGVVADGALKDKRIQPIPRGEVAFADGGNLLEQILTDAIRDVTGSEPVMKGQAQKGAPASLFAQQVEESQSQLMSSAEYFLQSQYLMGDLVYAFSRQFFTERRIMQISGDDPTQTEQLVINTQRANQYLNDPSHGLYTVYKISAPLTESSRRRQLGDALEVATTLGNIGLPTFVQDLTQIVNNLPISQNQKTSMLNKMRQWQEMQGIGEQVGLQQAKAQAQQAQNQATPRRMPVRPA